MPKIKKMHNAVPSPNAMLSVSRCMHSNKKEKEAFSVVTRKST